MRGGDSGLLLGRGRTPPPGGLDAWSPADSAPFRDPHPRGAAAAAARAGCPEELVCTPVLLPLDLLLGPLVLAVHNREHTAVDEVLADAGLTALTLSFMAFLPALCGKILI